MGDPMGDSAAMVAGKQIDVSVKITGKSLFIRGVACRPMTVRGVAR